MYWGSEKRWRQGSMKSVRSEENTGFPGVMEDTGSSRRHPSRAPYTLFFVQFVSHPVTETSTNLYVKKIIQY